MENQMDAIINQLSHIEDTAVRIMESADTQKKELALEMEQRTKDYDLKLAASTTKKLDELKERLNAEKESELAKLRDETETTLKELENKYASKHSDWAQEILSSMTRE